MRETGKVPDPGFTSSAVVEAGAGLSEAEEAGASGRGFKSPSSKTRSMSDGGGTPRLSPSPLILEGPRGRSKDDSSIRDTAAAAAATTPSTPVHAGSSYRGLPPLMHQHDDVATPSQQPSATKPAPPSPKLDQPHVYASPTNILPRRSRGLDFSRAATSLHHSTLAEQASPDSSPTIGSRMVTIPGRRAGDYGSVDQTPGSLWPVAGNQERSQLSGSLGSNIHTTSDASSSSDDYDFMDEDMDDAFINTPQAAKVSTPLAPRLWSRDRSPAANSFLSFQQRQRPRKQHRKSLRGPLGLGSGSGLPQPFRSRSPPASMPKEMMDAHSRRESISWAANQLHISGNDSDDNLLAQRDAMGSPSRPTVIKRAVTRRGNLLPKTKGFARIRAALAEESAPIDAEFRREAEVVRQVRESDMDYESQAAAQHSAPTTALSSPSLAAQDNLDEMLEDAMMMDPGPGGAGAGLPNSFKQQAMKNSKGRNFWDNFSETSSSGKGSTNAPRVTPPPPLLGPHRGSSCGLGLEDVAMDSPSASSNGTSANPFTLPAAVTTNSSSGNETPQVGPGQAGGGPSAAEVTRRINSKRRREDEFDPVSFKRRAVSPGVSVHNSPLSQSPMQRDPAPWGSRPGSVGGDTVGSKPPASGSSAPSENGSLTSSGGPRIGGGKGRVGYQGMIDTNDGITKLSIE